MQLRIYWHKGGAEKWLKSLQSTSRELPIHELGLLAQLAMAGSRSLPKLQHSERLGKTFPVKWLLSGRGKKLRISLKLSTAGTRAKPHLATTITTASWVWAKYWIGWCNTWTGTRCVYVYKWNYFKRLHNPSQRRRGYTFFYIRNYFIRKWASYLPKN